MIQHIFNHKRVYRYTTDYNISRVVSECDVQYDCTAYTNFNKNDTDDTKFTGSLILPIMRMHKQTCFAFKCVDRRMLRGKRVTPEIFPSARHPDAAGSISN